MFWEEDEKHLYLNNNGEPITNLNSSETQSFLASIDDFSLNQATDSKGVSGLFESKARGYLVAYASSSKYPVNIIIWQSLKARMQL